MSKVGWCPVCGQPVKKKKAMKRLEGWVGQTRLDRLLIEKLERLAEGHKAEWVKAVTKLEGVATELEQAAAAHEMEGAALSATGRVVKWDSVAPADEASVQDVAPSWNEEDRQLRRAMQKKVYMKAWHARKKAEREAAAAAKEKPQAKPLAKQLEHQRAYNRSYYHKHKRHLADMRKRREARARASNGHRQQENTDGS